MRAGAAVRLGGMDHLVRIDRRTHTRTRTAVPQADVEAVVENPPGREPTVTLYRTEIDT